MRKTSLILISSIFLFILINISLVQAGYVWIKVQYDDSCPTYWGDVLTLVNWPNDWDPFGTTNTSGICDRKDLPNNTVYQVQAWYGVPGHEFGDLTPYETDSNGNGHVIITSNAERGGPCPCGLNVTAGSPIAFGNVYAGSESSNQTLSVKNTGTANTVEFRVFGTNWTGTSNTMPVGQTSVYDTAWNNLTASHGEPIPGVNIFSGHINSGETKNIQFKVAIPAGQAADTYNQTITFTGSC